MDMDYIDIGVNLLDSSFEEDRDEVIDRAFNSNIRILINTSSSIEDSVRSLNLAKKYPSKIFTTAGIHPHNAATGDNSLKESLTRMRQNDCMVAIGECGLDYHYGKDSVKEQKLSFITQINVARDTGLPLIIHSRDADEDMIDILTSEFKNGPFQAILHCFSSGKKLALCGLDLGFYISFSGMEMFQHIVHYMG
mgnify:CR=1 FL=1